MPAHFFSVMFVGVDGNSGPYSGRENSGVLCKWSVILSRECGRSELVLQRVAVRSVSGFFNGGFGVELNLSLGSLHLMWSCGTWSFRPRDQMTRSAVWCTLGSCNKRGSSSSFKVTRMEGGRAGKDWHWISWGSGRDCQPQKLVLNDTTNALADQRCRRHTK